MAGAASQSREIDGCTYHVQPLTTLKALGLLTRVLKMAGPGFADVASLRQAASAVGVLLSGLAAELDEDVVKFAVEQLAGVTQVELTPGKRTPLGPVLDLHFTGRLPAFFAWLRFAGEVTYGPLVEALQAQAGPPPEPAAAAAAG